MLADAVRRGALEAALAEILTPGVLRHLPEPLQLSGDTAPVARWVTARERDSEVYVVTETGSGSLVGLLLLSPLYETQQGGERQLGYLLAESTWGKGYGSELVSGLVMALRPGQPLTLRGGVDRGNRASARVLEKAGFHEDAASSRPDTAMYILRMT